LPTRLARIETLLEEQRQKQHIPGMTFVAVRDDRVIFLKAFGVRDVDRKLPATPETVFPIGSCTKAFTAMAVAVSQDRGVLSLDDRPHKFLPYFKMADPEANALVTLRDMLCHRTGLKAYADLAAEPAVLSREEYVRAATSAKPTAKFRAKFQYSNAMYSAVGEILAKANHSSWEQVVESTLLGPLRMTSSTTSAHAIGRAADHATGYVYREETKDWTPVAPPESLKTMAPAGSIASTARDLAQWLRLLTGVGSIDGKRIVSEAALHEVMRPHIAINDTWSYGLGWVTYKWNGHTVVEHNGGSRGLSALMSLVPDRHIGFALLANTSPNFMTAIGNAGKLLWPLLLDEEAPTPASPPAAAGPPVASPAADSAGSGLPIAEELLARMVQACGGEDNLRRHSSMEVLARKSYQNQGVEAELTIRAKSPDRRSEEEVWTAAGKTIGRVRIFFDGSRGGQETTFGQDSAFSDEESERARRDNAWHALLDLKRLYDEVKVEKRMTIDDEDTYAVKLTPRRGKPVLLYVSARTALIVQREAEAETTTFRDYRNVDGEFVPFRTLVQEALGEVSIEVKSVRFNVALPSDAFSPSPHAR